MTNGTDGIESFAPTGMFVWWNIDDSKITPARLRQLVAAEGVAVKSPVPDINPANAIKRATGEWSKGRGNARRYKAEVTRREGDVTTVGLLTRERVDKKTVEWVQVGILEHDASTGSWTVLSDAAEHDEALSCFKSMAVQRITYLDHRWIRPNILSHNMAEAKAQNLRNGAGFYFAPRQAMERMKGVRRLLGQIGDSTLRLAVVGNDPDTVNSVAGSTRDNMVATINDVQEQLRQWSESSRKVRTDSEANVLSTLADLVSVADTYEAALSIRLDDLRSDIESARRRAMEIIEQKS